MKRKKIVVVAGTGRSGTTWLAEVLNASGEYEYIFEPFRTDTVDLGSFFQHKAYLRPDLAYPDYKKSIERLVSGEIHNEWTHRYDHGGRKTALLIKTIRANLLLKWMKVQFPEIKILLILRHPCAVALSQMQLGWQVNLQDLYLQQASLVEDYLQPYIERIKHTHEPFMQHILLWCIEYYVPLRQFVPGELQIVFYENLFIQPRVALDEIFSFLELAWGDELLGAIKIPSAQVQLQSAIMQGGSPVDQWTEGVSAAQLDQMCEALALFELDGIYGHGPMPGIARGTDLLRGISG